MRLYFDYAMILVAFLLQYVYIGMILLELWLALPVASGYNWHWHITVERLVAAVAMYLSGCFVGSECETLQAIFKTKYPEEEGK